MKKVFYAALLALPVLAAPARADGGVVFRMEFGCCGCCGHFGPVVQINCCGCQSGAGAVAPWYMYWPAEAQYLSPAPTPFPYWPTSGAAPASPGPALAPQTRTTRAADWQPASYYSYPPSGPGVQAPSYWYSR